MLKKSGFLIISFLVYGILTHALAQSKTDSLENVLRKGVKDNEALLKLYSELTWAYVEIAPVKAQKYAKLEYELAAKLNSEKWLADGSYRMGMAFSQRNIYDSALVYYEKCRFYTLKSKQNKRLPAVYNAIGNVYKALGRFEKAIKTYFEGLKVAEKDGNKAGMGHFNSNIGGTYVDMGLIAKGIEYHKKSIAINREIDNQLGVALTMSNLGACYGELKDIPQALFYTEESVRLLDSLNIPERKAVSLVFLGRIYISQVKNLDKALAKLQEALKIFESLDHNTLYKAECLRDIAEISYLKKDFTKARQYAEKAHSLTDTASYTILQKSYNMLARIYIAQNETDKANQAFEEYEKLTKKIYNAESASKISEMEVKYQTQKKQHQIELLEKQHRIKILYIIILAVLILLLAISGVFVIRASRRKRVLAEKEAQIKEQRISELEKEKQLTATQALLEGENTERTRLARDLHDGLGGMLSVVKLKLADMKGNATLPEEFLGSFHNALEMLDSSIRELRRVAHNLMPESLMRYGLKPALTDFCAGTGKVNFHFYGDERRIGDKTEVAVYRIIHELVNNALKHADAAQINVQLIMEPERVGITVQDDGKGFDPAKIDEGKSGGLANVRSRVDSLGGRLDFLSAPGQGTEVNIEINC
jgi:two-component system, NarL family, sensor kinase